MTQNNIDGTSNKSIEVAYVGNIDLYDLQYEIKNIDIIYSRINEMFKIYNFELSHTINSEFEDISFYVKVNEENSFIISKLICFFDGLEFGLFFLIKIWRIKNDK